MLVPTVTALAIEPLEIFLLWGKGRVLLRLRCFLFRCKDKFRGLQVLLKLLQWGNTVSECYHDEAGPGMLAGV